MPGGYLFLQERERESSLCDVRDDIAQDSRALLPRCWHSCTNEQLHNIGIAVFNFALRFTGMSKQLRHFSLGVYRGEMP